MLTIMKLPRLSAVDLKAMFSRFSSQGQTLFTQHRGEIETRARCCP